MSIGRVMAVVLATRPDHCTILAAHTVGGEVLSWRGM